ncbi:FAD-binding domain-containing protein [Macroventuria anomochaeta]|uniref:FAD-binding domain-containing protein n=1 Tax=Macroventuria anomochaeta TaxID=301207 RepID=A0ACB6SF85_9PLEO|nr:FAD-binding domain-containing protein [Macroventuria anomochaeta]KAF2632970.1 FAD-binding domain-containing protein [Macroventuria anomochaeta]
MPRKFALLCASALGLYFFCTAVYEFHGAFRSYTRTKTNTTVQSPIVETPTAALNYSCIPGQPCWPSEGQWTAFNQSIDGNLRLTVPWASTCYSDPSSKQCQQVRKGYMDGISRTAQYGSMEFLDWETCGQSHCYLDSMHPSSPTYGTCGLGRLSTYHVEAHTANDISKTLDFVRQHGIRVSIKNTGHDYFGRSSSANSLGIWTHHMKDAKYHKNFQPQGCKTQYENIGEVGAGTQAQEAWEFFEPLDMLVTVGAVGSVGIAGGFGQGGGHGPLAPSYGLMVDQAVEFDVVTADGQKRIINECTDPDLFWAMRGGGGGNYAVLTSYKFQLHAAVPLNVHFFRAHWPASADITESKVLRDIVSALASNQTLFSKKGIAGYNFILPDHMVSLHIMPSTDTSAIKTVTKQYHDFLASYPDIKISNNSYHTFSKFSDWHAFTEQPCIARNGPVGLGLSESGRFIPKSLFSTPSDIDNLTSAVLTAMQLSASNRGSGSAQLYSTGPANHPDGHATSAHPLWRDSLWHVIMGGGWTASNTSAQRTQMQNTISASIQPFKALTPGGGCYVNEGDWMEENWQQTFFGSNYDRLLKVKKQYDPSALFQCWKCVGWTGYQDPMYSCYGQSGWEPQASIPLGPVG